MSLRYNRFGGLNRNRGGSGAPSQYAAEQEISARNADMMKRIRERKASGERNYHTPAPAPIDMAAMALEDLQVARIKSEFVDDALNQLIVAELIARGIQV